MTRRSAQPMIPTGNLPTIEEKQEQQKPKTSENPNPLATFFRKSKLNLTLPSHGKWYPSGSIIFDTTGSLPVYAMNANDDIKMRTGDATMSGKNVYEVVQSCVPNIIKPELIPHIDIDAILLAIRVASYGPKFDFIVQVPKTTLTRAIQVDANKLLSDVSTRKNMWDEEITITDEITGQSLYLVVHPVPMKNLFATSKNIYMLRKSLSKNLDQDENIKDESSFSTNMNSLAINAIDLLCSSIKVLQVNDPSGQIILALDSSSPQDEIQIKQTIHQLDIEYFNSLREHIDNQRQKYAFFSDEQISTPEEIKAGAPEKWIAELTFMGSDFLPETKSLT